MDLTRDVAQKSSNSQHEPGVYLALGDPQTLPSPQTQVRAPVPVMLGQLCPPPCALVSMGGNLET